MGPLNYLVRYGKVVVAALALIAIARGERWTGVSLLFVAGGLAIFIFIAAIRIERECRAEFFRLKADRFKFCPDCGYDLRGCDDEGPSPECAALYDPEFLEQTWTLSYKPPIASALDDSKAKELVAINHARQQRWIASALANDLKTTASIEPPTN